MSSGSVKIKKAVTKGFFIPSSHGKIINSSSIFSPISTRKRGIAQPEIIILPIKKAQGFSLFLPLKSRSFHP